MTPLITLILLFSLIPIGMFFIDVSVFGKIGKRKDIVKILKTLKCTGFSKDMIHFDKGFIAKRGPFFSKYYISVNTNYGRIKYQIPRNLNKEIDKMFKV